MTRILGTAMPQHAGNGVGYEYPATVPEVAAVALLLEMGWTVTAPACPACHGRGAVNESYASHGKGTKKDPISYDVTSDPCPNGCATPAGHY